MRNIKVMAIALMSFYCHIGNAQEAQTEAKEETKKDSIPFNRWSVEINAGANKGIRPYAEGFNSSRSEKSFGLPQLNHFDLGARYMITAGFGFKLDFAYDRVTNQNGSVSLPFDVRQYRVGLQGVGNIGRLLKFEDFTDTFGLLAHAGIQATSLTPKMGINESVTEYNGGVMFGLTPQVKISRNLVATLDFTILSNIRQHFNWDGSYSDEANNLSGQMYNASLGLTWYIGRKEGHADWYIKSENSEIARLSNESAEATRRLDEMETLMNDTDKDGILDYLDVQNNTPNGVTVDAKGRFIDTNNNGTPDELEPGFRDGKDGINSFKTDMERKDRKSEAIAELVNNGYLNVFFDINKADPNSGSTSSVYHTIRFMKQFPEAKIKLTGFADRRGNEKNNKALSIRRAEKLRSTMIASGINPERVTITGEGVDNSFPSTRTGLNLARRVSITIE